MGLVAHDSYYGNGAQVATAIGDELRAPGSARMKHMSRRATGLKKALDTPAARQFTAGLTTGTRARRECVRCGGPQRVRTADLRRAKAALSQLS